MRCFFLLILSLFNLSFLTLSSDLFAAEQDINLVVLANKGHLEAFEKWKPLADYLQNKTGIKFKIIPYNFLQIESSLLNKSADVLITNPQYFVIFQDRYNVKPLATVKNGGFTYLCGVIIARKDSKINKLEDIENKKIAVVSKESAFGYLAQTALLLEKGIDIREKAEIWSAENQDNVVYSVLNRAFQVGFLNADLYNKFIVERRINPDELTVINGYKDKNVPYICSTDTWPDWTVYTSANLDPTVAKKIQTVLLNIDNDSDLPKSLKIPAFAPAQDYSNVKKALDLLSGIKTPPPKEEPKSRKK